MQNEIISSVSPVALTGRSVDEITADIRINYRNAKASIIQIGRDLAEVKQLLQHGEWLPYLKGLNISVSTAENYMHYAGEVSDDERLAALPYSGAMALIALPEGEREQLLSDGDLEGKTSAEIKRLIAEVKSERQRADTASDGYKRVCEERAKLANDLQAERMKPPRVIEKEVAPADYADLKEAVERLHEELTEAENAAADAEERAAAAVSEAQRAKMQQLDEDEDEGHDGKPLLSDFIGICNEFQSKVWAVPFMGDVFRTLSDNDLKSYRLFIGGVKSWAERALAALDEATSPLPVEGVISLEE